MRPLHHAIREVVRFGKVDVQQVGGRRRMGGLSLASTVDRRKKDGVDARRPTAAMELKRAAEVQKCADKGWKSALICLGNMRKGGVAPGSSAYNVALKACAGAGEWGRAAALVEDMQGSGAIPDETIVAEIRAAGDNVVVMELGDNDDLSCDSGGDVSSVLSGAARNKGGESGGGIQDAAWPSRRPTNSNNSTGTSGGGDFGSAATRGSSGRSLGSIAWGGRRWRSQHDENEDENASSASPATRGVRVVKEGGSPAWSSVASAPFAGSWGDD
ncbi:hypothetical protein Esi_0083_0044 [Ectocarpus siliculosus]|uniref:Pentacotripeptide-repeat region of PRORP domain-containing protein n=1 Tax=Ectocarpus siliculosus TaxID=2880 RepID=D7G7H2_ECTSI|nr:hypothetical protein Esi_0083_0044 [Ectocarpus siliculosus]|eukprot:CBJ27714.1 hypothetical protein Esi_0083_0044 [Ectocarpus siliculosus]